jgi:hypothetical protein
MKPAPVFLKPLQHGAGNATCAAYHIPEFSLLV